MKTPHSGVVPCSKNTERLLSVSQGLLTINTSLLKVQPVISEAVIMTSKIDGYVTNVVNTFDFIDTALKIFDNAMDLLKYLGKLIPTIGPMLSQAADTISKLDIGSKIRRVLDQIKKIVQTAKEQVIANFKRVVTTVSKNLDAMTSKIPIWQQKVEIMGRVFKLVDVIFYTLANKIDVKDIEQIMVQKLNEVSGGMLDGLQNLLKAFRPVQDFISNAWQKFKTTIGDALSSGLEAFSKMFQPFFDVMKNCIGVLDKVKEVFQPFFWVLDGISWLWEKTIGRLIDWVKNELGIIAFIDRLVSRLQQALGIDELKETIRALFEDAVSGCCKSLRESVDGDGSIIATMTKFADTMSSYKDDPAGTLVEVLLKAFDLGPPLDPILAPNALNLEDMLDFRRKPGPVMPTYHHVYESMNSGLDVVQLHQHAIDGFLAGSWSVPGPYDIVVTRSESPPNEPDLRSGVPKLINTLQQPTINNIALDAGILAPKLTYTTYQDECVSVALRTSHKPVVELYIKSASTDLLPLAKDFGENRPSAKRAHIDSVAQQYGEASPRKRIKHDQFAKEGSFVQLTDYSSQSTAASADCHTYKIINDAMRPGFSTLTSVVAKLSKTTISANSSLQAIAASFAQADRTFAAFDPRSMDFVNHLVQQLHSLEPILEVVENLLEMPFHYRTRLATVAQALSSTDIDAPRIFNAVYNVLEDLQQCTARFDKQRVDLITRMGQLEETYTKFGTHVQNIRSQSSFPTVLGPNVLDLASFGKAIEARLSATLTSFAQTVLMADHIFSYQFQNPETELLSDLDQICYRLAERAEIVVCKISQASERVVRVHGTLENVHEDVKSFYTSASLVSNHCRELEAKLIAADKISDFCARVNNIFAPLQSVLEALGFKADEDSSERRQKPGPIVMKQTLGALRRGDLVANELPSLLGQGLDRLAWRYFHFDELENMIQDLQSRVSQELPDRLHEHDEALMALYALVKPQLAFDIKPDPSMPQILIENALFDDQTQKDMMAIMLRFQHLTEGDESNLVQAEQGTSNSHSSVPAPPMEKGLSQADDYAGHTPDFDEDIGLRLLFGRDT